MTRSSSGPVLVLLMSVWAASLPAQPRPAVGPESLAGAPETRTARAFDALRGDPVELRAFLRAMPKGGDLHHHFSGAIYAEHYIRWAAELGFCVDTASRALVASRAVPADGGAAACVGTHLMSAAAALDAPGLFDALVDSLSMRNTDPAGRNGSYHFFGAFPKFLDVVPARNGEMLAEITRRASLQNVHYIETFVVLSEIGIQWPETDWDADFEAMRHRLLAGAMSDLPARVSAGLDRAEARRREVLGCSERPATAGCEVIVRYGVGVLRGASRESVFSQMLAGFEAASRDPRVVTLTLLQPEDWQVSLRDYDLHMRMLGFLHDRYPAVPITLHAGELVLGQVPPEELGWHVPAAVRVGRASRIGHATDVMHAASPDEVLAELRDRRIAVEVCLTSSDLILGLRGERHPLRMLLRAGVPVVLATDDEGVARIDLTHEYQRAVEEHGLSYLDLKHLARNALEFSFLSGASLSDGECPIGAWGAEHAPAACRAVLDASEKARAQWALEARFATFEAQF